MENEHDEIEEEKSETVEKHLKKSSSSSDLDLPVIEKKIKKKSKDIKVMLIGKLDNPKLECLRELHHEESDCKMIPLGVKKS